MPNHDWRKFEQAVAAFLAALEPRAHVRHDIRRPDKHTGTKRQRDVWIEATIAGVIPITILVSCKRLKRKLNQQDIDHFAGELASSCASKGVLYSYSGFAKDAVAKAKQIGIECCRLYETQPADIPESLPLQVFTCRSAIAIEVLTLPPAWDVETFADLFALDVELPSGGISTLRAAIAVLYDRETSKSTAEANISKTQPFPKDWRWVAKVTDDPRGEIEIAVRCVWRIYRAAVRGQLLDGTYNYTSNQFVGTQYFRAPALQGELGADWELLAERPRTKGTVGATLIQQMADLPAVLDRIAARKIEPCGPPSHTSNNDRVKTVFRNRRPPSTGA